MPTLSCGYDQINYDESVYDGCNILAEIDVLLSFTWGLVPLPEENPMSSTLAYELNLQATDPQNNIKTQAVVTDCVPLSMDILSDDTYSLAAGVIDQPINFPNAGADVMALIPTNGMIAAKVNGLTGTPFNIKKLFFLDGQGVTQIYVSNPNAGIVSLRVILGSR